MIETIFYCVFQESGIEDLCKDILSKWSLNNSEASKIVVEKKEIDVNEKLSQLIEDNTQTVAAVKTCSREEQALKQAILAQYGQVTIFRIIFLMYCFNFYSTDYTSYLVLI